MQQARYTVSADVSFQKVGGKTKIPYHDDFYYYKRLLEDYSKKAPIRELFRFWDNSLFGGAERQPAANDDSMGPDIDELDALDDETSGVEDNC